MSLAVIVDIGNVVFFVASLPQVVTAYRNRNNLRAVSNLMLLGFTIACFLFAVGNASFGAYVASALNVICSIVFTAQMYWKRKYKNVAKD